MLNLETRAEYNFIRYANCWEDADVLLDALRIRKGDRCLSIASAGDNSLSLLVYDPEIVVAVDISPAQLACLELRIAGFKSLGHAKLLELLGVTESDRRRALYQEIRNALREETRRFFDDRIESIRDGVIFSGKFENYFRLFRTKVLPFIHSGKRVSELLAGKSIQEQCLFYRRKWNNLRFRFFFNLFFSRKVMARHGRDPAFFAYVEGGIVRRLRKRAEYALTEISTYSNPYLHFILRGNFAPEALPHYLRKENFEKIKANINKIVCFQGSIRQAVDFFGQRKFDAFNLSDVFEYMSRNEFASVLRGIEACATKGARIAYWDLFAGRQLSALGSRFVWDRARAEELFKRNKAFFYDSLVVGIKQD